SLAFGTTALPTYDGSDFAKNQDVVVISLAYRLNVFGFPMAEDLTPQETNLGFLDQELAFQWVQNNIAQFGGDLQKVTIMGQFAGAQSVSGAFLQHNSTNAPFRASIILSGAVTHTFSVTNHTPF
ncbi:uncharacterized protein PHACADRAFT_100111, partial [Phanerochaete carnosa HHB-10118-sp]